MAEFFTSRKPPRRSRVNLPHEAWAPSAGTGAGVGAVGGGVSGAGVPAEMSRFARVVSVDDAPLGSLPDPRRVALGRNHRPTNVGDEGGEDFVGGEPPSVVASVVVVDQSRPRLQPLRRLQPPRLHPSRRRRRRRACGPRMDVVARRVVRVRSRRRRFRRIAVEFLESSESTTDDVGEPVPATLRRRMVEQDGVAVEYPRPAGVTSVGRVRRGGGREDRAGAGGGAKAARRAQPGDATDIQAQVRPMGSQAGPAGGAGVDPKPGDGCAVASTEERGRTKCTTREAVEGLAHELTSGTYRWWGAMGAARRDRSRGERGRRRGEDVGRDERRAGVEGFEAARGAQHGGGYRPRGWDIHLPR